MRPGVKGSMFIPGTRRLAPQHRLAGRISKRATSAEKAFIQQLVEDKPDTIPIQALATVTGRHPATIKKMILQAKEKLNATAEHYVETHRRVMDAAFANGDPKALEVAGRMAQWGMQNIVGVNGERIVEKPSTGDTNSGVKVMIGVKIGGLNEINGESGTVTPDE